MNSKNYSVEELVHNESFRSIVKGTASPEELEKWSRWIEQSDEHRQKAKRAISKIAGFRFAAPSLDFDREWSRLYSHTIGNKDVHRLGSARKDAALRWVYRVAAVLLLISMVGLGVYLYSGNNHSNTQLEQITQAETVHAAEGQQKTLKFTNGNKTAKIVLNSNSSLTYNVGLLHDQPIEVTLQGEAFFDVEQDYSDGHPAFSVVTPDGVIEDLGTEFLVMVEKDRSRVVLQEGLVNVKTADRGKTPKEFQVTVGEMVEFNNADILKKGTVNSSFYTAWATGSIQFDQTRIRTFAEYIEQRFSVEVQVLDPELAEVTLDGAVYFKSLEGLVRSVSDVTGVPVYQSRDRDTVYIGELGNSTE